MKEVFDPKLWKQVRGKGIVAVLVIDHVRDAATLARTLLEGGVGAMELTLRTPAAVEALRVIRREVPEMLAGIGTILTPGQVTEVVDAGAAFGVSPGCNPRVIEAAKKAVLSFAPGVATRLTGLNRTRVIDPSGARSTMSFCVAFHRPPLPGWYPYNIP